MTTILDCALLAEHAYDPSGYAPALGWVRRDGMSWPRGFTASTYIRDEEAVIAFRCAEGSDPEDWHTDLVTWPSTEPSNAGRALDVLLRQYDPENHIAFATRLPELLEKFIEAGNLQPRVRQRANSVPTAQLVDALRYFDRCRPTPRFIIGHSLGGALAQLVAQHRSVGAVSFNSPNMADLGGVDPATSGLVVQVNAAGDPLSIATRAVENLAQGRVITVTTPPPPIEPPPPPRAAPSWAQAIAPIPSSIYGDAERARYQTAMFAYLLKVAGYFHSMAPLRLTISRLTKFRIQLREDMANAEPVVAAR